jgi:GNAT superfamily N-acetyltransferase
VTSVVELRRATAVDARAVADVYLRSRHAAVPAIPPSAHDDDDVRDHFATLVLPEREVWVADDPEAGIIGLLVLHDGWLDHLYLAPGQTGRGLGSRLLDLAKHRRPDGLELWAFQSNVDARRFYERHGFGAVRMTEDDNEEGAPDVLYRWPAPERLV